MSTAFARHIRRTVDEFLQTVVMVDDEAFRQAGRTAIDDADWENEAEGRAASTPAASRLLKPPAADPPPDYLDVRAATTAFGLRGLACAMLSPQTVEENAEIKDPFLKTARRADLVVLDWNLNNDFGKTTVRLMRAVLKKDDADDDGERRLRVVAVYTGEPDLDDIARQMRKVVSEVLPEDAIDDDPDGLPQFTCGPVRVTVLAKEYVRNLRDQHQSQQLAIDDLPERLRDEFAQLCNGLVAAATVSALTGIRAEAHRLLTALGRNLDPAYLGQRARLNHPAEAERQLEALLTAEIGAIIADREVGRHANMTRIRQWLADQPGLAAGGLIEDITRPQRLDFLKTGLGDDRIQAQSQKLQKKKGVVQEIRKRATELFVAEKSAADHANRLFSERMVIRTRYSKPDPVLRLGAVIERGGDYALCVQPVCDSVRLKAPRVFPFLRLARRPVESLGPGTFVLRDRGQWIALAIDEKPGNLTLLSFDPTPGEVVRARKLDGAPKFVASDHTRHRWVADLKVEQAQRTVENLARQFSRVGLTEPEFLRLS